jgi:hypothetical protein
MSHFRGHRWRPCQAAAAGVGPTRHGTSRRASRRIRVRPESLRVLTHHTRPRSPLTTPRSTSPTPIPRRSSTGGGTRRGARTSDSARATTIRQFLDADLVDTMHVAVSPRWNSDPGRDFGNHPMSCSTSPPRGRAQPERRDPPPVLAKVTRGASGLRGRICLCAGTWPSWAVGGPLSQLRLAPVAAARTPPPKLPGQTHGFKPSDTTR